MNTDVTVDVNFDGTPAASLLKLIEAKQKVSRHLKAWQTTINKFPGLFKQIEDLGIELRLDFVDGCMNLNFTGDAGILTNVWKELRRAGFKNDSFPSERKDGTFCTHWRRDHYAVIWMFFTSSVCKRIQVGTQMVEQPIYETRCGELPVVELSSLGELIV